MPWITGGFNARNVRLNEKRGSMASHLLRASAEIPLHAPVAVPDARLVEGRAGQARARAVQALGVQVLAAVDVAQGQVREPRVAHVPHGCGFLAPVGAAVDAPAEEGQLESEAPAVFVAEIAGVIPPLGLKFGVIEVVARELIAVAGQRRTVQFEDRPAAAR
jgi:hypothetical protein